MPLQSALLAAFRTWSGRYIGPMTQDIAQVIEENPDLLGEIVTELPKRFNALVVEAIAKRAPMSLRDLSEPLAETLVSTSIGIKHQVPSLEEYTERLRVAIGLLLPDDSNTA